MSLVRLVEGDTGREKTYQRRVENPDPDYVLKCIEGVHQGRFIYINLVPEGETIGESVSNSLCVQDAGLEEYHCKITYRKDLRRYRIEDLSKSKGVWIKVSDILLVVKEHSSIMVDCKVYRIEYKEKLKQLEELGILYNCPIVLPEEAKSLTLEEVVRMELPHLAALLQSSENDAKYLQDRAKGAFDVSKRKPIDQRICFVDSSSGEVWLDAGWAQRRKQLGKEAELIVQFKQGRYNIYATGDAQVYYRLDSKTDFFLNPDDVVRMGELGFRVDKYNTGCAESQGTRDAMLDFTRTVQELLIIGPGKLSFSYFAIYDGHGRKPYVELVHSRLHQLVRQELEKDFPQKELLERNLLVHVRGALDRAFYKCDLELFRESREKEWEQGGCTVVGLLLFGRFILCFNLGDSRAILCKKGRAIKLSTEHKANNAQEHARVTEAGGFFKDGRVNGIIQVTRSLGDYPLKKFSRQDILVSNPELTYIESDQASDEFLLLGSDGLFEDMREEEVVSHVRGVLLERGDMEQNPTEASQSLVKEAVRRNKRRRDKSDNVSAVVICLTREIVST